MAVPDSPAPAGSQSKVWVRNLGPNASGYTLFVDEENMHASCDFDGEGQRLRFGTLRGGATRVHTYAMVWPLSEGDS